MAKRLTDTQKWDDPWFAELPSKYKLFWLYLLDECDHAGIWKINFRKAQFMIGESLEPAEVYRYMNDRITKIDESYWIVNKFIKFQYGELRGDKVSASIVKILERHNLTDIIEKYSQGASKGLARGYQAPKDKDKDKDKVKDMVMDTEYLLDTGKKITYSPDFERVWELYERRGSKAEAYKQWKLLTPQDRKLVVDHIPRYLDSVTEPRYQKHFERYIKQRHFESEPPPKHNIFSGGI